LHGWHRQPACSAGQPARRNGKHAQFNKERRCGNAHSLPFRWAGSPAGRAGCPGYPETGETRDTNSGPSATIIIDGNNNGNEWFQLVSGVFNGVGLAYHAPSNHLILSLNTDPGGPFLFKSLDTNVNFQFWSGVDIFSTEVQIACVPPNLTNANFTNGDLFLGTGVAGLP
jgi:hypothetical protein